MKNQSIHSRLINFYLLLTDRKSKYQERWFYSNPKKIMPRIKSETLCKVKSQKIEDRNVWIFEPNEGNIEHSIFFLHGGGFAKNFQPFHWRFIERMTTELNARIIAPDYPLLPDASYKQTHQFIVKCYHFIHSQYELSEYIVIGDSSGATLALNTSHLIKQAGLSQPKEFILLSPWLDLSLSNPQIDTVNSTDPILDIEVLQKLGKKFADDLEPNHQRVSPIYQDLRRIAPITVFIGTRDIMLADCRKLKILSAAQPTVFNYREFEGMFHNWMYFDFPEGKMAREMIFDHIRHEPTEFEITMQENEFGW